MARQTLTKLGYHVTTCTSSIEALELFQAKKDAFDLIITDYAMPRMTGDMLAEEILHTRNDIPIIMCTGYSKNLSAEKAKELGIRGFVQKPIDKAELARSIRDVLDSQSN